MRLAIVLAQWSSQGQRQEAGIRTLLLLRWGARFRRSACVHKWDKENVAFRKCSRSMDLLKIISRRRKVRLRNRQRTWSWAEFPMLEIRIPRTHSPESMSALKVLQLPFPLPPHPNLEWLFQALSGRRMACYRQVYSKTLDSSLHSFLWSSHWVERESLCWSIMWFSQIQFCDWGRTVSCAVHIDRLTTGGANAWPVPSS